MDPTDTNTDNDSNKIEDVPDNKEKSDIVLRVPKFVIVVAGVAVALFFAGYGIASFQKVGFDEGYDSGYSKGLSDLIEYNTQPDRWVVIESRSGMAAVNGSEVGFAWLEQNTTKTLLLRSLVQFRPAVVPGTLFLMTDPIQIPPQLANSTDFQPKLHYVLQDESNNRFILEPQG